MSGIIVATCLVGGTGLLLGLFLGISNRFFHAAVVLQAAMPVPERSLQKKLLSMPVRWAEMRRLPKLREFLEKKRKRPDG